MMRIHPIVAVVMAFVAGYGAGVVYMIILAERIG